MTEDDLKQYSNLFQNDALAFVRNISQLDSSVDYSYLFSRFSSMLSNSLLLHSKEKQYHPEEINYFDGLEMLFPNSPETGFLFISLLLIRSKGDARLSRAFEAIFLKWFESDLLQRTFRITWILNNYDSFSKLEDTFLEYLLYYLIDDLIMLAQEDEETTYKILKSFCNTFEKNGFLFISRVENREQTLELAKLMSNTAPEFKISALIKCFLDESIHTNRKTQNYQKLSFYSREIFKLVEDEKPTQNHSYEYLLRILMTNAPIDEDWYDDAVKLLWTMVSKSSFPQTELFKYSKVIYCNSSFHSTAKKESEQILKSWISNARMVNELPSEQIIKNANDLITLINDLCHEEYSYSRNTLIPPLTGSTLINESTCAYLHIVDCLEKNRLEVCFKVLLKGIKKGTFPVEKTNRLCKWSYEKFVELFERLLHEDLFLCSRVFSHVLCNSGYFNKDPTIEDLLNEIWCRFIDKNNAVALKTFKKCNEENRKRPFYFSWNPNRSRYRRRINRDQDQ